MIVLLCFKEPLIIKLLNILSKIFVNIYNKIIRSLLKIVKYSFKYLFYNLFPLKVASQLNSNS